MHGLDAAALFAAPVDGDRDEGKGEDAENDIDSGCGGADADADGWVSRGGSPVNEGDEDAVPVRLHPLSTDPIY